MQQRRLAGRTVAALGVGDASFARAAARGHDAGDVARCLHEALELGIDVLELAAEPDVERAAGDAVRAVRARDRAVVATQLPALASPREVHALQEHVEASLRATRLDGLPLVQLPLRASWRTSPAWPELVGTCARLVREGKVLAWGAIVDTVDARVEPPAAAAPPAPNPAHPLADAWLAALAIELSLCARDAAPVLAAAATHAIFARRPLAGGALAGTLGPGVVLARSDDRRGVDLDAIAVGVAKLARFVKRPPPAAYASDAARAIAETAPRPAHVECDTLAELALRYAIDRGTIALPRITRREDLHSAIAAASAPPLSAELTSALDH